MRFSALCALACLFTLAGCKKYKSEPLVPQDILAKVERARQLEELPTGGAAPAAPIVFTFERAAELAGQHSPALAEAHAEYETAAAASKIKTPLPNPSFEAGPIFGFGPDVSGVHRLQPFGSLGFAIPTGGRLKRQDELNQAAAALSRVELQAKHREIYLELRKLYTRLALSRELQQVRKSIVDSAGKSVETGRKLLDAGMSTQLDFGLLELEHSRLKTDVLSVESESVETESELAGLLGVAPRHFSALPPQPLPDLPAAPPPLSELRALLLNNQTELARLRARYEVAERELHLEIAKQYPDFRIGPTAERETGERKMMLGLTLGIDLPIFDRNQQAVATALKKREEVRIKYEGAANRALSKLERAAQRYRIAYEKLQVIRTALQPKAKANLELSNKMLTSGAGDALRFLETERAQRNVTIDEIESSNAAREALIELEQAVGYPLLLFPSEKTHSVPAAPGALQVPPEEPVQ